MRSLPLLAIAVLAVVALSCGGASDDDVPQQHTPTSSSSAAEATAASPLASATGSVAADEVEGHWSGDWGDMYLRTEDGVTRGVYPHDTGTVQGRISDGVFAGWWCEAPSRQAPSDAGAVEFRFIREVDGTLRLDGRWKYGNEGDWAENWDLALVTTAADPATEARLENDEEFCEAP